jgi:hypothetical protein
MEGLQKTTKENKIEKPKIKEGLDFVFKQNPELSQIGTKEQYSEYLDTIFPDSKVKDIVYCGSKDEFEKFRNRYVDEEVGVMNGIYLTHDIKYAKSYGPKIKSLLINTINPLDTEGSWTGIINDEKKQKVLDKGYDVIINKAFDNSRIDKFLDKLKIKRTRQEIVLFEPEQIHTLGSKQDIADFKKFVENNRFDL